MIEDDGLGPPLLAPPGYLELRVRLREAMGFPDHRRPLLIGIDGVDGSGKSSLAVAQLATGNAGYSSRRVRCAGQPPVSLET